MSNNDIHKAAGVIIVDRKVLTERSVGKDFFIHPGGKIEVGETPAQALVRELKEEFQIDVSEDDLELFYTCSAPAANSPERTVHMEVYFVKQWNGDIVPDNEVEEIRWLTTTVPPDMQVASILEHETLPRLKKLGLID